MENEAADLSGIGNSFSVSVLKFCMMKGQGLIEHDLQVTGCL